MKIKYKGHTIKIYILDKIVSDGVEYGGLTIGYDTKHGNITGPAIIFLRNNKKIPVAPYVITHESFHLAVNVIHWNYKPAKAKKILTLYNDNGEFENEELLATMTHEIFEKIIKVVG